jgi:DNA-directed RNA polymerase subunit N (RpoN/RPB10)
MINNERTYMKNKTKCDSCGEETAYDQWSSYSNDNAENWCIDCGEDIHNEWVAECNANWQEMIATDKEENPEAYDDWTGEKL